MQVLGLQEACNIMISLGMCYDAPCTPILHVYFSRPSKFDTLIMNRPNFKTYFL